MTMIIVLTMIAMMMRVGIVQQIQKGGDGWEVWYFERSHNDGD